MVEVVAVDRKLLRIYLLYEIHAIKVIYPDQSRKKFVRERESKSF